MENNLVVRRSYRHGNCVVVALPPWIRRLLSWDDKEHLGLGIGEDGASVVIRRVVAEAPAFGGNRDESVAE